MLDAIKKKLFSVTPKEVDMSKQDNSQTVQAAVDEKHTAEMTVLQETLASQSAALEAVTGKFAELQAKYSELEAQAAAADQSKADAIAEAKAVKAKARTEAITAVLGTEQAPALLAATESLDDKAFANVIEAMTANRTVEAKSTLFTEVGVSAVAEVPSEAAKESAEAKLLKAKFKTK
jgi:hypothetical protein